jgi:hypothetical protein
MKTIVNYFKGFFFLLPLLLASGCTKRLNEELFSTLSPANYYKTPEEALSSVVGVYQRSVNLTYYNGTYRATELGTDEYVIAARTNGGWFDGGVHIEYALHKVTPQNAQNNTAWGEVFGIIGAANAVMQSLQESPGAVNLAPIIAEVRALRANAYYYAMDLWGNVPIVTVAKIDPANLPKNSSRADVFKFVETELLAAATDLPSVTSFATAAQKAAYYPRFTKEAVYATLATVYLNAGVYTGTEKWKEASDMSDKIISTGAYILEPQFMTNFVGDNDRSRELISSFAIDPAQNAGGNQFVRGALNPLHVTLFNPVLPFVPANGFNTTEEALNRYEAVDIRRRNILWGPQVDVNGAPIRTSNGSQLVLIPIKDLTKAEDNEGYKVLKYVPNGKWVVRDADNDVILTRYADILLIKGEALFRTGSVEPARTLVNQVRARSSAPALTTLTLKDIEDERGRELLWEGHRRRDLIRFGTYFTGVWKFHTTETPKFRGLYPIPEQQLIANRNLVQNPGY